MKYSENIIIINDYVLYVCVIGEEIVFIYDICLMKISFTTDDLLLHRKD